MCVVRCATPKSAGLSCGRPLFQRILPGCLFATVGHVNAFALSDGSFVSRPGLCGVMSFCVGRLFGSSQTASCVQDRGVGEGWEGVLQSGGFPKAVLSLPDHRSMFSCPQFLHLVIR